MQDKKKIYLGLCLLIMVMIIIEVLFAHPHYHMIWNTMPGADIVIGFFGAWLLIFLAKKVMAFIQQRNENYYDDGGEEDAE